MALTKPILYDVNTFDASKIQDFLFESIGGDQVVANQLTIINQATGNIVYQEKQITNAFKHILPAGTLDNGDYYSAYIVTYNLRDEASTPSISIQFRCYSQPIWRFINIPENNVINNATYIFEIEYDQIQDKKLYTYETYLYNEKQEILEHEILEYGYPPLSTAYAIVDFKVEGLDNTTVYYIRATAESEDGGEADTGLIQISTLYSMPDLYSSMTLEENCNGGYVSVKGNVLAIRGHSKPEKLKYVESDTAVLMNTMNGNITWDENISLKDNFRVILWGRSLRPFYPPDGRMFGLTIKDDDENTVTIHVDNSLEWFEEQELYRLQGVIYNKDGHYQDIYSNTVALDYKDIDLLQQIVITKTNGIYELSYNVLQTYSDSDTAIIGTAIIGMMVLGKE